MLLTNNKQLNISNMSCPICLNNLGRIYRTLHCTHQFHHKCLKQWETESKKESCPCCRRKYENMVLRNSPLTTQEKIAKTNLCNSINCKKKEQIKSIGTKGKITTLNILYKEIIINKNMILNKRFGFRLFIDAIKIQTIRLSVVIKERLDENKIYDDMYTEFNSYKDIIINEF
jgi:hypothetical protein